MCPEFASGRTHKDWRTADRRRHCDRLSPARTDSRRGSDKNRDIVQSDRWESTSHRTACFEDREPRCSLRRKNYCDDDTDRKPRPEQNATPLEYRRQEQVCTSRRSRSRSPGRRKMFSDSDSYTHREARNDLRMRRHTDNVISRARSPYKDRSSHSRSSTQTRSTRPVEQERYVDVSIKHSASEPESLKHQERSHLSKEVARHSKYSHSDAPNSGDKRTYGTRASSHHSDELIVDDCSARRQSSYCDRQSHAESFEDVRHSRQLSSERKADYKSSVCRCRDGNDYNKVRTDASDHRDDRTNRHIEASLVYSRNEMNSKSRRDRRDKDWRTCTADRRRSSPNDVYTLKEDRTVAVRKQHSYSDGRQSSSRDHHHRSENRNYDRANSISSFEESTSEKRKLAERYHEHPSDVCVPSQCSSKEESSILQSRMTHCSHRDSSVVVPATAAGADDKQCFAVTTLADSSCPLTGAKADANSSSYYTVTLSSAAEGGIFLGSLSQPMIQPQQQWINSTDAVGGIHLLRPQWPRSTVMAQHTAANHTRLQNFVPTAAVTQLPLLSTRISAVPTSIDPHRLVASGISLNSNINLSSLPSNTYDLATGGGVVGQYVMDSVYGDSPLLDEPSYHSPVTVHDSSLNLVGSSVSSVDCMRTELLPSLDEMELKKMLDVVTVAKNTLEQTLPRGCLIGPDSLKQQKVMKRNSAAFTTYMFVCRSICLLPR